MADLNIEDVSVRYRRAGHSHLAVDGVSLQLPAGRTLGLVGESGSGKSSLGRAIVGLVRPSQGRILHGDRDVSQRTGSEGRRAIQMVFQDPRSSLDPRMTVRRTLTQALRISDRNAGRRDSKSTDTTERAADLLEAVALPSHFLASFPRELSGGQRQRIALARALACEPEVIVADEITSALDVSVQAAILQLLVKVQRERGLSLLFISHNLAVIRYLSDDVAVMRAGRIVEHGSAEDVLDRPQNEYTRLLRASVLDADALA